MRERSDGATSNDFMDTSLFAARPAHVYWIPAFVANTSSPFAAPALGSSTTRTVSRSATLSICSRRVR